MTAPLHSLQYTRELLNIDTQEQKVLGVRWDKERDCFRFKVGLNFSPKSRDAKTGPPLTLFQLPQGVPRVRAKRMVLGQVNSVHDPLGLASPFLIKMKVLDEETCGGKQSTWTGMTLSATACETNG